MFIYYPSKSDSTGCLSVSAVSSQLQHWSKTFFTVVLPILDHHCNFTAASTVPGIIFLTLYPTVPNFHSLYKSNTFAIVKPLMFLRFGLTFQIMFAVQHLLPHLVKSSKLTCLPEPIHYSLPVTLCLLFDVITML